MRLAACITETPRDAGGWASAATVDGIYALVDIHAPVFDAALCRVWGER